MSETQYYSQNGEDLLLSKFFTGKKYGFYVENEQLYLPFEKYSKLIITEPIPDLASLAIQYGTSYRMLKVFNPWLIGKSLSNKSGKTYEIMMPNK